GRSGPSRESPSALSAADLDRRDRHDLAHLPRHVLLEDAIGGAHRENRETGPDLPLELAPRADPRHAAQKVAGPQVEALVAPDQHLAELLTCEVLLPHRQLVVGAGIAR